MNIKKHTRLHLPVVEKSQTEDDFLDYLLMHIKSLGCKTADDYYIWCTKHGFKTHLNKNRHDLNEEIAYLKELRIRESLSLNNKKKKMKAYSLNDLMLFNFKNEEKIKLKQLTEEQIQKFCQLFNLFKSYFQEQKTIVEAYVPEGNNVFDSLYNATLYANEWLDVDVKHLRLKENKIYNRQEELLNHLFSNFKVPSSLCSLWNKNNATLTNMLINLYKGASLKKEWNSNPYLNKLNITAKEIHRIWLGDIKGDYIEQAVVKVILQRYKTPLKIKKEILNNDNYIMKFCKTKESFELFDNYIAYMSKQVMFDVTQLLPFWDFIEYKSLLMKRERKNWELKHQNIINLYEEMVNWHTLTTCSVGGKEAWETKTILPLIDKVDMLNFKGFFKIIELKNVAQLQEEGSKMKHCVASYARRCSEGNCSIWSLRKENSETNNTKRILTIEVNSSKKIVQIRGVCNRKAEQAEIHLVQMWARQNNLIMVG